MAKKLPYYRWFPSDARGDAKYAVMNDTQLGFFHRCLDLAWENGGIPSDLDELAEALRVTREYLDAQWIKVGRCFVAHESDQSLLVNKRQEEERSYAESKSAKATSAVRTRYGRSTDVVRTNNERNTDALPRAYGSVSVSVSESVSESVVSQKEPIPFVAIAKAPAAKSSVSDRFEEFWEKYPVKDGYPIAKGVWETLVTPLDEDSVFACLDRYLASDRAERSPKNPSNWLHDCSRDKWKSNWPPKSRDSPGVRLTKQQELANRIDSL